MSLEIVISLSGPLLTAVAAVWWANYVLGGENPAPGRINAERRGDIRTW